MKKRERRAEEIQAAIRKVLLEDWNPVGFSVPSDEYDSYIGGIYRLLYEGASLSELTEHLVRIEFREFGTSVSREDLQQVAVRLSKIPVRLDSDCS